MTALDTPTAESTHKVSGREIRRIILEQSYRAHVGHIGSALSVADLIAACYGGGLNLPSPDDPARDRFVLSKGHAALALYSALFLRGWITAEVLATYCADGSLVGVHPHHDLPGVDFSTGSLGQGLSMGVGSALADRIAGSARRVAVLVSDAECNEGSVWEAAAFAAHHRLDGLRLIIDLNGQQALGYTRDVIEPSTLACRFDAFGWEVRTVDGHDGAAVISAMTEPAARPRAIVAKTVFGRGVSYMEHQIPWHYLPMDRAQFEMALQEVAA